MTKDRSSLLCCLCLACSVVFGAAARTHARLQEGAVRNSVQETLQGQPLHTLNIAKHHNPHKAIGTEHLPFDANLPPAPTHQNTPGVQQTPSDGGGDKQHQHHGHEHHNHASVELPGEQHEGPTFEEIQKATAAHEMSQKVARLVDQAIEAVTADPDKAERLFAQMKDVVARPVVNEPVLQQMPGWGGLQAVVNLGWEMPSGEAMWKVRMDAVRLATQQSWAVYETKAMGQDELRPLTMDGKVAFGGLGATLLDSLSTLWMMNLTEEFDRAVAWVAKEMMLNQTVSLSLFETNIRIVAGLLSTHDLSGDTTALLKAEELVQKMLPAFNGGVLPTNTLSFNQQQPEVSGRVCLAEFGSLQMEFWALSERTGNSTYADMAEGLIRHLDSTYPGKGLLPTWFDRQTGYNQSLTMAAPQVVNGSSETQSYAVEEELTIGAMADSYYEYLLKMWILKGKQDDMYRRMWERAMDESLEKLYTTSLEGLAYMGKRKGDQVTIGMDHLSCFFPGMLSLGAMQGAVEPTKAAYYMEVAQKLTHTCYQMYARTATGLCPEEVRVNDAGDMQIGYSGFNDLRPETVESLFYLWRATKDPKYREWGWDIFRAFQMHSRTPQGAFARVANVNRLPAIRENFMESFWLAETLKYLWLLFGPDELLDLNQWVLNTEAHPLRIVKRA